MKLKWFDVRCPWCKKMNSRKGIEKHLYIPIECYKCHRIFYINSEYEVCKTHLVKPLIKS